MQHMLTYYCDKATHAVILLWQCNTCCHITVTMQHMLTYYCDNATHAVILLWQCNTRWHITWHPLLKIIYNIKHLFTVQDSCLLENFDVSNVKQRRSGSSSLFDSQDSSTTSETSVISYQSTRTNKGHDLNIHRQRCKPQISRGIRLIGQVILSTWRP
jgi:hypothetical protein